MKRYISFTLTIIILAILTAAPVNASSPTMDSVRGFDYPYEGRSMVKNDEGKIGFANEEGDIVIPCIFENAYPFKYGIALVKIDGKQGFIDRDGNFVIEPKYNWISKSYSLTSYTDTLIDITYFENGPLPFSVYELDGSLITDSKSGLLDRSGKEILPAEYTEVSDFSNGLAFVRKGDLYGAVNVDGDFVVPIQYNVIRHLDLNNAVLLAANKDSKWGLLDYHGKELAPPRYDELGYLYEGCIAAKKDGKWGFIDTTGETTVPFLYDETGEFFNGITNVRLGDKWGFIDTDGIVVTPIIYDEVYHGSFNEYWVSTVCKDGKWGIIDNKGELMTDVIYDYIDNFQANSLIYVSKDDKYGYLNSDGDVVIPLIYDGSADRINGAFAMIKDGKVGIIDNNGKSITPFEYDEAKRMHSGLFILRKANKWGCVDANGKIIIPFEYDEITDFGYKSVIALKDGKYGALSLDNEVLIPFEQFALTPYSAGEAAAVSIPLGIDLESATWDDLIVTYFTHPDYLPSSWAAEQVRKAQLNWLIPFDLPMKYMNNISRTEYCLLAAYLIQAKTYKNYKSIEITKSFTDTDIDYISAMASIGIVSGVGGDKFDPHSDITREEAAVMLKKAGEYLGMTSQNTMSGYIDSDKISPWAMEAVNFVTENGIMTGINGNRFDPKGKFTGEQAIITMLKLFEAG